MQKNVEKYLILFASCVPVKGAYRATICDLQRCNYEFIPNDLADLLLKFNGSKLKAIYDFYGTENKDVIDEYLNFLLSKEYIFFTDNPISFPKINFEFDTPNKITYSIIDYSSKNNYKLSNVISQIDELGCYFLQFRSFDELPNSKLLEFSMLMKNSRIRGVDLIVKYSQKQSMDFFNELFKSNLRIKNITVHSAIENKIITNIDGTILTYAEQVITDHSHCGNVSPEYFSINMKSFPENLHYNSCLNKKISIDINGKIKNCPSMNMDFGNINKIKLKDVIDNKNFKKTWMINKDKILICKNCDFRYICTDCRAYIETPENIYSKPLKCKYDPYSGKWQ